MNYKLLFPTYRNRYRFIREQIATIAGPSQRIPQALNLGTGEGDYDAMIAPYCEQLTACDINEQDVAFARELNRDIPNIRYAVEDALALSFPDAAFDLLISVDVLEHVGRPERMVEEIGRVLRPGGLALITFPSLEFPFTYDPINRILSLFSDKKIPQGAYAFGHEYLVLGSDFRNWAERNGLEVLEERNLSGALVALAEMYWTGIIQRIFKANATNVSDNAERKGVLRPTVKEPGAVALTDALINLDRTLFGKGKHSVGKGFVLQRRR
jgi:SAM-dependent methyltransferase